MSLTEIINKAVDAIKDLSSLEVQTYTGKLTIELDADNKVKTKKIDELLNAAQVGGTLNLVLVTKHNIDGDGINIVPPTAPEEHVIAAHKAALESGELIRSGMFTLFKSLFNK